MRNKEMISKLCFKVFSSFLLLSFILIILLFVSSLLSNKKFPAVIFFDIGQGDSSLIRNINGKNIVIDGGPDNKAVTKVGKYLPYFDRKIDYLILSHYHEDHVTGLIEMSKRYKVDKLFLAKGAKTNYLQDTLIEVTEKSGLNKESELFWVEESLKLDLGLGCYLSFLNPKSFMIEANDNDSLINKLSCPGSSFLFSGDNELKVEEYIVENNINVQADVLKASHHGSKTSNTLDFLRLVSPNHFVVSAGLDNRNKHPSAEVVDRVSGLGISIMRTDFDQDVVFELNLKQDHIY